MSYSDYVVNNGWDNPNCWWRARTYREARILATRAGIQVTCIIRIIKRKWWILR